MSLDCYPLAEQLAKALEDFTERLERGDLSKLRITKLVRNEDGSYTRIVFHEGKVTREQING